MKVLVVEDDLEIQALISYYFKKEGFEVSLASDGLEGLKYLKKEKHELVILDLMLPNLDGINFTKIVKTMGDEYGIPYIIMLTAKTEVEDVLMGLEIGADDYMKKPFDPRELLLRGKKLLNQHKKNENKQLFYRFLSLKIDENKHLVTDNDKEIVLSKKEYDLLLLLVKNIGIVISREKILDKVWGSNYYSGDRTVDVYVSKLREKIPFLSQCIRTIKGVGYRLEEKK